MDNYFGDWLFMIFISVLFFGSYCVIRRMNIHYLKYYFIMMEIILLYVLISLVSYEEIDIMAVFTVLVYQAILIVMYKKVYRNDKSRSILYTTLKNSNFHPLFIYGIQEIPVDKLEYYVENLNVFFDLILPEKKLNYGFFMVDNGEIQITMFLLKQHIDDIDIIKQNPVMHDLQIENYNTGCQIKYCIKQSA